VKLCDIFVTEALRPSLAATTRDEAIAELVEALADAKAITKKSVPEVTKLTIKRENQATTGIGKGISLPHTKMKGVSSPVATIGKSSAGLDFSSLDNQTVTTVILMVSNPDNPDEHLQAMEIIFRNIKDERFRKFLLQAQTSEAIIDLLKETDEEG